MPVTDLDWPNRLLAGGGPATPDPRVLRALGLPSIGQFDPAFTAIMDEVMGLARQTWLTANPRCFAVSSLAPGGLEAFVNTLLEAGDRVAIGGGPTFFSEASDLARRYGVEPVALGSVPITRPTSSAAEPPAGFGTKLVIVPLVDGETGALAPVRELAAACRAAGTPLLVDATCALGAQELRVDEWQIDACLAGVDHALGAPSGMTLITYSVGVERLMLARRSPPPTSYLDLLQLQAYWSPERLNHHTAPTNLIYGLREALRLLQAEGLPVRWARHGRVGAALRAGLAALGLRVSGEGAFCIVQPPQDMPAATTARRLLEEFDVQVRLVHSPSGKTSWRIGLIGPDATLANVLRVLSSLESVLCASGATQAGLRAYGSACEVP